MRVILDTRRDSKDETARFAAVVDDRALGRPCGWAANDASARVRQVSADANREQFDISREFGIPRFDKGKAKPDEVVGDDTSEKRRQRMEKSRGSAVGE